MKKWYGIQNYGGGTTDVSIFDEIGLFGVTAQDFLSDINAISGPLNLHLNSGGGEVFQGIAIYNALRKRGNVSISVEGLAASIASVIAMAADPGKLSIAKRASMMIHNASGLCAGDDEDMKKTAELLRAQSENIAQIYADRTGKTAEYWRTAMKNETWYIGQEAVSAGLADSLTDGGGYQYSNQTKIAANTVVPVNSDGTHAAMRGSHTHGGSLHTHNDDAIHATAQPHTVDTARALLLANGFSEVETAGLLVAEGGEEKEKDLGAGWMLRGGKPVFDPDGDGDDDATPEGDTDHDYWDESGKQIKAIPDQPGKPGTGKPLSADVSAIARSLFGSDQAVDNSPWDAAKAWHNGSTSDDPAAFFKAICAGRKSGDPDTQAAWALPYKYTPKSPPNAAGVRAALGRLSSTQGLTNKQEAQSLLEGLMKKINPDYEPSNLDGSLLQALFISALEGAR